jgi:diguanylate cyclase (GGDEF)-like protein
VEVLSRLDVAVERLGAPGARVVLAGLAWPEEPGPSVLRRLREAAPAAPILVIADREEDGHDALRMGAQDVVIRGRFDGNGLVHALRYAITLHALQTQLHELSLNDPLTGLYNHRGFMLLADHYFKLARRAQRSLVVTYIDLDGLQHINETYGRAEGDQALVRVAIILRNHYRESDIMARVAGDEFAFVALGATDRNSEALAARLSDGLRDLTASAPPPYELSLSVGMAWFNPESPASVEDLVSQARAAMDEHRRRKK